MKLLLKIEYDGKGFCGFQFQPGRRTVQGTLTEVFSSLYGFDVAVTGCSRTDSGVHALGFCITLDGGDNADGIMKIPPAKLHRAANNVLPSDIAVLGTAIVPDDFHPRYNARGKEYVYKIYDGAVRSPFLSGRAMHFPRGLDNESISRMDMAASYLVGRHDLTSFMASGSKITDPVRTVFSAGVLRETDGLVCFTVSADGFLYNTVRIMTGTLIDVAEGRLSPDDIPSIIEKKDRSAAGATVLPDGLYLKRVIYPDKINFLAD